MKRLSLLGLAMALLAGCGGDGNGGGGNAPSLDVVAVTTDNRLVTFDTENPNVLLVDVPITGLGAGQTIVGIDERPTNGDFYAVSNTGTVYTLDVDTGVATAVGVDAVTVDAAASASDIDFNPQVDRIRLGNASDQNIRINPDTGAQVDGDADGSNGIQGDTAFYYENGAAAEVVGLAYTNSISGATSTVLYAIDRTQDSLVALNSTTSTPTGPNGGRLVTVGSLGVNVTDYAPFDITPDNLFALAAIGEGERSRLAIIDLATGSTEIVGRTPTGLKIVGLAIAEPIVLP